MSFHSNQVKELRHKMQEEYQAEYEELLVSEKKLIKANRGGYIKEDIGDEVSIVSVPPKLTNQIPTFFT